MGTRAMAELKTESGSLFLYQHYDGDDVEQKARDAVKKAAPRLGDDSYWLRIMVDQMQKSGRDSETGYGIMLKPNAEDAMNDNKPHVVVDATTRTLTVISHGKRKTESF